VIARHDPSLRAYTRNNQNMSSSRRIAWMVGLGSSSVIYSAVRCAERGSEPLNAFGNLMQCRVPLLSTPACSECRYAALAAKPLLDAYRHELHALDDRAVPVDHHESTFTSPFLI